jgi:hypothetical protein
MMDTFVIWGGIPVGKSLSSSDRRVRISFVAYAIALVAACAVLVLPARGQSDVSLAPEICAKVNRAAQQLLADYGSSLGALGKIQQFSMTDEVGRGGMIFRAYQVSFATRNVNVTIYEMPDGKIEQFHVGPVD